MLLDGPDYQHSQAVQIHPDIPHDEPAKFGYGQVVSVGDDEVPSVLWPLYSVADIPFMSMSPVNDPERPGKKAFVEQVYLVREPEWEHYPMPGHIREIIDRRGQEPEDQFSVD